MNRALIGIVVLLAACSASAFADSQLVVQSGHVGPANAVVFDQAHGLLFSGGDDGTVRAWNPASGVLARQLQVDHLPVRMLAVSRTATQLAAFVSDNISIFRLEVWDWNSGRLLFTRDLSEAPLFLTYSPTGRFIVYGVTEWRSLTFLDARTGDSLPYLANGFGIVSAVLISESERSILTYGPSGEIDYWSLETGALKQSIRAVPNLSAISFTPNALYMIGTDGVQLAVVNLVTGALAASTPLPGIQYTAVDPVSGSIACYVSSSEQSELTLWSYSGALYEQSGALLTPDQPATSLAYSNGTVFASLSDGTLFAERPYQNSRAFGANQLLPVDDFAANQSTMLLTTPSNLLLFDSDFFAMGASDQARSLRLDLTPNSFQAPTGVSALRDGRFVLWRRGGSSPAYSLYDPSANAITPLPPISGSGLVSVAAAGRDIATLDSAGQTNLVDPNTGVSLFSYTAFGIKAIETVGGRILAGKTNSGALGTALMQINTSTGETVPIPTPDLFVYDLAYSPQSGALFTLGVQNEPDGGIATVLERHDLATLSGAADLRTYGGEDLDASLVVDPGTGDLYTTLGYGGVKRFAGSASPNAFLQFERSNHVPRKLVVVGSWIVALNTDSTLSVWNKRTGQKVLDFYIFKDYTWIALLPSGLFYASAGAGQHIGMFDERGASSGDAAQYELQLRQP